MADWGGTDAESLKKGIDSIFQLDGALPLEHYQTKLVSITTDGASVNTGRLSGLMTRMASDREWLVKIHCINHRIELAVKDALVNSAFKDIDSFYLTNFYLLRDSGKIKSEVKIAAEALGIQHYTLPKMTGTIFVGHRRKAFEVLLNLWPAFISAYQNVSADPKTCGETKGKVMGLLRNFQNYRYVTLTCAYLDILEKTVPASKVFEGENLLPFDVKAAIEITISDLREYSDVNCDDFDSHTHKFQVVSNNENSNLLVQCEYNSPGDKSF